MRTLAKVQVIIFDWDGTIIQSNEGKEAAFFRLFEGTPGADKVIKHVLNGNRELSRYAILEKILAALNDQGISPRSDSTIDDTISTYTDRYEALVFEHSLVCPEVEGASSALRKLKQKYPLYVSSTTPVASLNELVRRRGFGGSFTACFGYPDSKAETLKRIGGLEKVKPDALLVVGDGESDLQAAQMVGACFIGIDNYHHTLAGRSVPVVKGLNKLAGMLGLEEL